MLVATNVASDDEQMSGGEKKVNENTYDISSIKHVTNKFLEVSRCSCAKQQQTNVQKKCCMCKVALLLIRPIFGFQLSLALHAFAAKHYMILYCLNKL